MKKTTLLALFFAGLGCASAQGQLVIKYEFSVNKSIPDNGELLETRTIAPQITSITDVDLSLNLSGGEGGGFNGDLYATLGHQTGFAVLLNRPGRRADSLLGYDDSALNVVFDDTALRDIHNYRFALSGSHTTPLGAPLSGLWAPDGRLVDPDAVLDTSARTALLDGLNGQPADGEWRLFVADMSAGGASQLDSWALAIKAEPLEGQSWHLEGASLESGGAAQVLHSTFNLVGETASWISDPLTFKGPITGSGSLTHSGGGTVTLNGANTFSGGVQLEAGALAIGHNSALGSGPLTLNGGTVQASGGARTLANAATLNGDVTFGGAEPLTFQPAATLTGNRSLTVENTTTFSGGLDQSGGSYGLAKQGSGTLVLQGNNTYAGNTTISAGRLRVDGSLLNSVISINSGGILAGAGTTGPLTIYSGGTISPGVSPGTLNTGPETWSGGGVYVWEMNRAGGVKGADPGWDWLNVNGGLTLEATPENKFKIQITSLTLDNTAGPVADFDNTHNYRWTIATASSGITGFDSAAFTLDPSDFLNNLAGGNFNLGRSGNEIHLDFLAIPEPPACGLAAALLLLILISLRLWTKTGINPGA